MVDKKPTINKAAIICEPGSSVNNKTGGWRTERPKIIQEKCKRCGACWKYCPDNAIKHMEDGRFEVDYDFCKGCLICFKECPFDAIEVEPEEK
jgi:pyruvate ferredoxin oxidoreductase delta subunit